MKRSAMGGEGNKSDAGSSSIFSRVIRWILSVLFCFIFKLFFIN